MVNGITNKVEVEKKFDFVVDNFKKLRNGDLAMGTDKGLRFLKVSIT